MLLPPSDSRIIARRAEIVAALQEIVPDGVVADPSGLATFDCDALSAYHQMPLVCVLPSNRQQVSEILKYAQAEGIPYIGAHRNYPHHLFAFGDSSRSLTGAYLASRVLLRQHSGDLDPADAVFGFHR